MTTPLATPGERLRHARQALKKTGSEIGLLLEVTKGAVSAWENDKVEISKAIALAFEYLLGVRAEWLLTGEGPMWRSSSQTPSDGKAPLVYRPILPGAASCGPGGEIEDPGPSAVHLPFRQEFIEDLLHASGGTERDLFVVECVGESMRPTVLPGDLALIHTALPLRMDPQRGGLYLVRTDPSSNDARIKRVRLEPGRMCFLSDAPGFLPIPIPLDDIPLQSLILGRLCWIARHVVRSESMERNW